MSFLSRAVSKVENAWGKLHDEDLTFLHGYLNIAIHEAKNLPNMEHWVSTLVNKRDVTDPFIRVKLGSSKVAETKIITNDLNPKWKESYRVEVCHYSENLIFEVYDKDHAVNEYIGSVKILCSSLLNGEVHEGWFPIRNKLHKRNRGQAHLRIQYVSAASLDKTYEVDCYFPMQKNCKVTLYQDAQGPANMPQFKEMKTSDGDLYQPNSCWTDLYNSIQEAKKIICINGWSVWDKLQFFRGYSSGKVHDHRTLGEILVDKANHGVKVYVMVWSSKAPVLETHDVTTVQYFKDTKVNCALALRIVSGNELSDDVMKTFSSLAYTHHQKSVICDAPNPNGEKLRLVAFVGGLDLTNGRWDTPNHSLFSTLLYEHKEDFHNANAPTVPAKQGPREPWHDIHSKVEGPIAHDVFLNFYERWLEQGRHDGVLERLDQNVFDVDAPAPFEDPQDAWNVQLFRSITSDSAHMVKEDKIPLLNTKKGITVDASILQAYAQVIRNADNFLYIENQYFLGSAYNWFVNDDISCDHTVPSEITQKIVNKISKGERFVAYILIPMFPEGDPVSAPIQEILAWQTRTIEMMYARVGKAIMDAGIEEGEPGSHPTDWLMFLCLGKKELPGPHLDELDVPTEHMAKVFRQSLRSPIYVHSKMLIVDDAYIIVGSANINQRSMAGSRDTEMAVGCWQPNYPEENPVGDVHTFRMSLWTEHFKTTKDVFKQPNSFECIELVKEMAKKNWDIYVGDEVKETTGHLLPYPLKVLQNGDIENIGGFKSFPDYPANAKIKGRISSVIPHQVTT